MWVPICIYKALQGTISHQLRVSRNNRFPRSHGDVSSEALNPLDPFEEYYDPIHPLDDSIEAREFVVEGTHEATWGIYIPLQGPSGHERRKIDDPVVVGSDIDRDVRGIDKCPLTTPRVNPTW